MRLPFLRSRRLGVVGATLGVALLAAGATAGIGTADAKSAQSYHPPKIKHVWTIVLENKSYEATFTGLNENSYLWKQLPTQGVLLRHYYGTSHFSEGNYLSLVSGQGTSPGPQADCPDYNEDGPVQAVADGQYKILHDTPGDYFDGSKAGGCVFPAQVQTLFNQLDAKHVSWKGYMQDMGADPAREEQTCGAPINTNPASKTFGTSTPAPDFPNPGAAEASDQYVPKHNPFPWFHSLLDNGDCAKNVVPLAKNLLQDLKSEKTTPAFSFITPDNCSDAHDATCKGDNLSGGSNALTGEKKDPANNQGGLYAADLFLKQVIPAIMASPAYQDGGLIDITFDEGFPPYQAYGNSIADKDNQVVGAGGVLKDGTVVKNDTAFDASQSIVACCNELPGPNTTQPGFQAFGQSVTPGGGITGSVLLSPYITPGSVSDQPYDHYSWLRSMEDLFGIDKGGSDGKGHLAYAGMEGLRPFGPDVYNNPRGRVIAPQASGKGGLYAAQQTLGENDVPVSYKPIDQTVFNP